MWQGRVLWFADQLMRWTTVSTRAPRNTVAKGTVAWTLASHMRNSALPLSSYGRIGFGLECFTKNYCQCAASRTFRDTCMTFPELTWERLCMLRMHCAGHSTIKVIWSMWMHSQRIIPTEEGQYYDSVRLVPSSIYIAGLFVVESKGTTCLRIDNKATTCLKGSCSVQWEEKTTNLIFILFYFILFIQGKSCLPRSRVGDVCGTQLLAVDEYCHSMCWCCASRRRKLGILGDGVADSRTFLEFHLCLPHYRMLSEIMLYLKFLLSLSEQGIPVMCTPPATLVLETQGFWDVVPQRAVPDPRIFGILLLFLIRLFCTSSTLRGCPCARLPLVHSLEYINSTGQKGNPRKRQKRAINSAWMLQYVM